MLIWINLTEGFGVKKLPVAATYFGKQSVFIVEFVTRL